ncbi:head-tail connector protein [Sutcliffiella rhizosphaerae]|uniref:Uncharacterized protein n=1 Tax=Sutcliffiella rhizosphaerae TaxID=2880967 RepID=A0ABN8A782_9BACI|nr:hypothetical protein [Sutcliffiella rhizosphaerae]CAG9620879.1 hypothetical protein BACCIP111883_01650 [Sutcliffiella rhizosphaerae]
MDVFQIVKAKLPYQIEDTILAVHIAEVGQAMKNYMNRSDIPRDLVFVHANMVIDLITNENRKTDEDSQQTVTSIREGDVQVQFGSARVESSERAMERLLFDYSKQLNRFRKLRW